MLNKLSATRQREMIRSGEVSTRQVLEAHIDQIETSNPTINAMVTLDLDGARNRANELDSQARLGNFAGPLHGLTVGIKDSVPVAGMRCTYGSLAFKDHVAQSDAMHVANLRDAGAVLLGKTNLPDFGHGRYGGQTDNAVFGLTRNPWNTQKTVSSSSGGAAAALAAYHVALADGSDIAGSIRGPAGWCGLYGLRPTSGVVPSWPKNDPLDGTSVVGPMARTIDDLALMLDAMRGPRHAPLHEVPDDPGSGTGLKGLRVAWCMTPAGSKTCDDVIGTLLPLREILVAGGANVTDTEPDLAGLHAAQSILRSFGTLLHLEEKISANPQQFSPELHASLARAREFTVKDLVEANRERDRAVHVVQEFFNNFDFMVWPTSTGLPFEAEATEEGITEDWTPIEITPVLQIPALSVPVGKTSDCMPCGVQLIGPKRSDLELIRIARMLEPEIGFVGQQPDPSES